MLLIPEGESVSLPFDSSVGISHRAEVFIELLPGCCHGRFQSPEITKKITKRCAAVVE